MSADTADTAQSSLDAQEGPGLSQKRRAISCEIHGASAKMHAPTDHNLRELCNEVMHFE
jgi:hypothetical protein